MKNWALLSGIIALIGILSLIIAPGSSAISSPFDTQKGIVEFGENVEVIILGHTPGHKGQLKADENFGDNRIKCSLARVLKCTAINSGNGLESVTLFRYPGLIQCDFKDTRDGAGRGSVDTRKNDNPPQCDYQPFFTYQLEVAAVSAGTEDFCITSDATTLSISNAVCGYH